MSTFSHYITRRYLTKSGRAHAREFPQLACYSFDLITTFIHLDGQYERDQLRFLAAQVFPHLPPRGTCLDVGANIGNHSLQFAKDFAKVISFEPHPRNHALLAINAQLAPNILPLNLGASSAAGSVDIVDDRMNLAASSIGRVAEVAGAKVRFDLVRIDDVPEVQAAERITFIKLDIEGHEPEAIRGAAETIRRHRPLIVLEVLADEIVDGTAASVEALKALGYRHFHEPVEAGFLGRLPRRPRKLMRALLSIVTGKRPSKAGQLVSVTALERRSYLMLLCSVDPPVYAGHSA